MAATGTHWAGVAATIASAQSTSSMPISAVTCGRCRITRLPGLWVASSIASSSNGL